jgi:hypothetical protein
MTDMSIKRRLAIVCTGICIGITLTGCAAYGNLEGRYDPEAFGEANRQTYAAMIAYPEPEYDGEMEGDAEKANAAIERYRADDIKEPDSIRSTTNNPGGG